MITIFPSWTYALEFAMEQLKYQQPAFCLFKEHPLSVIVGSKQSGSFKVRIMECFGKAMEVPVFSSYNNFVVEQPKQ